MTFKILYLDSTVLYYLLVHGFNLIVSSTIRNLYLLTFYDRQLCSNPNEKFCITDNNTLFSSNSKYTWPIFGSFTSFEFLKLLTVHFWSFRREEWGILTAEEFFYILLTKHVSHWLSRIRNMFLLGRNVLNF